MGEKNQERQIQISFSMQVSEHYRHSFGVWVGGGSDKSATQEIQAKELSLFLGLLYSGRTDGLQNKPVFGFEKWLCRNRYRACSQSKVNLSLNSAFSWPTETSCKQVYVMFNITKKGFWPPPQKRNGTHFWLDHCGSQVARCELLNLSMRHFECSTIMPHQGDRISFVTLRLEKKINRSGSFYLVNENLAFFRADRFSEREVSVLDIFDKPS